MVVPFVGEAYWVETLPLKSNDTFTVLPSFWAVPRQMPLLSFFSPATLL